MKGFNKKSKKMKCSVLIPVYFKENPDYFRLALSWIWCVAIVVAFVFYSRGFFHNILGNLIAMIPFYGERFGDSRYIVPLEKLGSGLAVLFWVIMSLYIAINQNKINRPLLVNLYLFGTVFL